MKKVMAIVLLAGMMGGMFPASAELVVTMEITSEMPALVGEYFTGKVTLVNNGTEAVKLVKSKGHLWFIFTQVRFFVDTNSIPIEAQEAITSTRLNGIPYGDNTRERTKEDTDFAIDAKNDFIILPAGQSCEIPFEEVWFEALAYTLHTGKRIRCGAELYVQPDRWIPIVITPPLEFAKDAKTRLISPNFLSRTANKPLRLLRVNIGTNEFLYAGGKRILDLSPDDQVEQNDNTRITITHKDGTKTEITSGNVDSMVKQREEKRKAKQTTGD